ncbi:MAG: hypothetical protein ACRC2T_09660 [Thermoguttaceae bacterium]
MYQIPAKKRVLINLQRLRNDKNSGAHAPARNVYETTAFYESGLNNEMPPAFTAC